MANNKISTNENIHVRVDQQNLIFIDPGTVVDNDGQLSSRMIEHENLVMYVNLEADLIPRSVLFSEGDKNTLVSIAGGSLNFLRNNSGNEYDTTWTETFVGSDAKDKDGNILSGNTLNHDPSGQSFGFESINIVTKGANAIPEVAINFIDVRGKTLFESPDNSPYQAFFHFPWPIFYLTVKGYYGKAIRYRLHMVDFKSSFNANTGNFEITTRFVGSTFAYLNDILLQNMLSAPYMYMVEHSDNYKENTKTGYVEKKISKTTKGYSILKSVYDSYKQKKLIPQDFPVKTLKDLIMTAESAERLLESKIFENKVDFRVLGSVKAYESMLTSFERGISAWGSSYLNLNKPEELNNDGVAYYPLAKAASEEDKKGGFPSLSSITGNTGTALQKIINDYKTQAYNNEAFGEKLNKNLIKDKDIKLNKISFDKVSDVMVYYSPEGGKINIAFDKLKDDIDSIQDEFVKQRNELETTLETKMNEIIQNDSDIGIGFKPTIRNIFAVILANADTYIRLMKDVHFRAIQNAKERQSLLTKQGVVDNKSEGLYPWPQIKKQINDNTSTILYPGDKQIAKLIKANDPNLWPEIEFIELYEAVATKRIDPLTQNEIDISKVNYIFANDPESRTTNNLSTVLNLLGTTPYTNKALNSLLFEMSERVFYTTSFDSFSTKAIQNLAAKEFETLSSALQNDSDIKQGLKGPIYNEYTQSGKISYDNILYNYSPFERYPYYADKLPTIDYIKEVVDRDFSIEEYSKLTKITFGSEGYDDLNKNLAEYDVADYRLSIYPFNTKTYLKYLGRPNADKLTRNDFNFKNILSLNENSSFISTKPDPGLWIKEGVSDTFFLQKIGLSGTSRNIINTSYFHKQIYNDFFKGGDVGRYAGSAYLFLNSLPFKDLDDSVVFNGDTKILMSSLFREIGSSHFIPYHLILKWGSIYHRYKKYLLNGVDIISGLTTPINTSLFYDNSSGTTFTYGGYTTQPSGSTFYTSYDDGGGMPTPSGHTVGVYPLYQNIYYQVVNGHVFFNPGVISGSEKTGTLTLNSAIMASSFSGATSDGILKILKLEPNVDHGFTMSFIVDNSKLVSSDTKYTVLPSFGNYQSDRIGEIISNYKKIEQDSFKVSWALEENQFFPVYSGNTLPTYAENFKSVSGSTPGSFVGTYSIEKTKRKVIDLIATFNPQILDEFETMFLEFSTLKLDTDSVLTTNSYNYNSFQDLLKDISTVNKSDVTSLDIKSIGRVQYNNLKSITKKILDNKNLVKVTIGNPKQLDNYTLYGVAGLNKNYSDGEFNSTQISGNSLNLIKLYIGEDMDLHYLDYFTTNNIELNSDNIYLHREMARIYAGYVTNELYSNSGFTASNSSFKQYLKANIITPQEQRYQVFFTNLMNKVSKFSLDTPTKMTVFGGYNMDKTVKVETYNFFKEFNDKWVAGNSIGQRNLLEEFLFIDRANKDIGNDLYLSLDRLKNLAEPKNAKASLYSVISMLIQGDNIDFRPLPAYVNFYGTNFTDKKRITPSSTVARNLFGTFLEVDYQEASPKMILQYIGPSSKYLKMSDVDSKGKLSKYKNDGADIRNTNKNPLLLTQEVFTNTDFSKSNRVVAFEVNFGDQAQNIFKSISLDQSSKTPTSATFAAYENLGRSATGSNVYQVDVNLFDVYRTYAYSCEVVAMGNAMIQPTMYFYLNNIPMFEGSYLITEVTHTIKPNYIETKFKGGRIPQDSLPNIKDSFVSAYRPLFDKILSSAIKKKQEINPKTTTSQTIKTKNGLTFEYDLGPKVYAGEKVLEESGFSLGIPYNGQNGEKYIQKVEIDGEQWLRTRVCRMGGSDYSPNDTNEMTVITKSQTNKVITWAQVREYTNMYYSTKFDFSKVSASTLATSKMQFYNPGMGKNSGTDGKKANPLILQSNINPSSNKYDGPIHNGAPATTYGMAMSRQLMDALNVSPGQVIYFRPL